VTATVLITGARAPVAVDLARAFCGAGCHVHLADSVTPWAAQGMRPRLPIHRFPAPARDFPAFRRELLALVQCLEVTLVVPTCEEVFWLAAAAERDGWATHLFAPDLVTLRRLHSKADFAAFAGSLGLDVPETVVLEDAVDPTALPLPLDQLVLKPEFSRFATHTLVAPRARRIASIAPTSDRRWVAQRRIKGQEICSWAAVRAGNIVAHAAYRPRWRHGLAAAYQVEAVAIPAVTEVTRRIAAATGLTGHLSFDIIVDEQGRAFPIECNPRAVSGLHLFDADSALARAILGEGEMTPAEPGRLRHLAPAMALLGLPSAARRGKLGRFLADWRRGKDVVGRGCALVTLGCLVDAGSFAALALRKGLSAAGATTADIEWDGAPIA
jgi:hypothetical protein